MTSEDFVKILGQSGVVGVLLWILGKVTWRVAERLIASIDRLGQRIDEHTEKDLQHHAEVKSAITRVEARIDGILDERERTPIDQPIPKRARTSPHGQPIVRHRRGGTE